MILFKETGNATFLLVVTSLLCITVSSSALKACRRVFVDAVTVKDGDLRSANFPKPYAANTCTEWIITQAYGDRVTLRFVYLDLPKDPVTRNCSDNYIKITQNYNDKIICGNSALTYTSTNAGYDSYVDLSVKVLFVSGATPSGRGFHISYHIGPDPNSCRGDTEFHCGDWKCIPIYKCCDGNYDCADRSDERNCHDEKPGHPYEVSATTAVRPTPRPTKTTTPRPAIPDEPPRQNCNSVRHNRTGRLEMRISAGHQGPWLCSWLLQPTLEGGEGVRSISLTFSGLVMPPALAQPAAYLAVYQGAGRRASRLIWRSDQSRERRVVCNSDAMLVVFSLGRGYLSRFLSFDAVYASYDTFLPYVTPQPTPGPSTTPRSSSSSCYHELFASVGNFSMPERPLEGGVVSDCIWSIYKQEPGSYIHLLLSTAYLQTGASIHVYDGGDPSSHLLGRFDYRHRFQIPVSLRSTGRNMLLKFQAPALTYAHRNRLQFLASYHFEDRCELSGERRCGHGDSNCYSKDQRCDSFWDCPLSGADEAGCSGCPSGTYSCNDYSNSGGARCYSKRDRCSGGNTCRSYADEMNCDETLCSEGRNLFLCANKRCILYSLMCDGSNDCGDGSDEKYCQMGLGSRFIIIFAVGGSLLGGLLLVLVLGIFCRVYAAHNNRNNPNAQTHPHHHHHRGPRCDTPLSRLQAEMFRRRAPPPPYHEAMLTSRPYDEVVRDYLLAQAAQQQAQHAEQENGGGSAEGEGAEESDVTNLINLMDFQEEEEGRQHQQQQQQQSQDTNDQHRQLARLEIRTSGESTNADNNASSSSGSDSGEDDDDDDDDDDDVAEDDLGHIEMSVSMGRGGRRSRGPGGRGGGRGGGGVGGEVEEEQEDAESILLENMSQDSASATLSNDSRDDDHHHHPASKPEEEEEGEGGEGRVAGEVGGEREEEDSDKEDSDADSVCILCLDQEDPATLDDGTDTACLLQDV